MKRAFLVSALVWLSWVGVVAPAAALTPYEDCKQRTLDPLQPLGDDRRWQRCVVIHNDLSFPIYPVIQSPLDSNCKDNKYTITVPGRTDNPVPAKNLRIVVNDQTRGAGIQPGKSAIVALPKTQPCDKGGFYDASRV